MASLVGILQKADRDRLLDLGHFWGLRPSETDPRSLVREILTKILDRWHLRSKLEEVGEAELQVLFHLAESFENWLTLKELVQRCRLLGYEAAPASEKLSRLGLVVIDDWQEFQKGASPYRRALRYPEPARGETAVGLPVELVLEINALKAAMDEGDISHIPVGVYLSLRNARELQSVAARWGIPHPNSLSKHKLITSLLDMFSNSQSVAAVMQGQHPETAKILARVQEKGGKMSVLELQKEIDAEALYRAWKELAGALILDEAYIGGRRFLFIPLEIRVAIGIQDERAQKSLAVVQPASEPTDSHLSFIEDLNTLMSFAGSNRVELTTAGYLPQKAVAKLNSLFHIKAEAAAMSPRLNFIVESGSRLGLIKGVGGRLVPGDSTDTWAGLTTAEQVKRVLNTWLGASRFEAPNGIDYLMPRISWATARSRVLKHLAANCKVGEWYSLQSFADLAVSLDQDLLATGMARAEIKRISFLGTIDVDKLAAAFVTNVTAYPLQWFGMVALARTENTALCFSLTPLGGWALDLPDGTPPPESSEKPLIVQPNFEILSIAAGGRVLHELSRFAELTGSDKVRTYTLTKDSILRGIDSGLSAEGILEFLEQYAQKETPQNVVYSVRDWARQYAPLSFSTATLVEVEEEQVLSELLASKRFSSYFSRRLSPNAAILVPGTDIKKLSNELRKRGYSPHLTGQQVTRSK